MTQSETMPTADAFTRQSLHVMAKPIGPICNLDCEYCYYLHKEELYPSSEKWRMPEETLETYITQLIAAQQSGESEIHFAWQGGEPTLLGLDFFKRIVALQQKHCPSGKTIVNALQTNGVLLTDEWCVFFRENGFLIGISIDGPAELHDRYRYDKKGDPTFQKVLAAFNLLKQHRVEFNVLVVVNRHNGDHGKRVYTYLRDSGATFIQFIPIVERRGIGQHPEPELADRSRQDNDKADTDALVSSRSVRPAQFGQFLIDVFDEWSQRDIGRVFVQIFDQALGAWLGHEPSLCVFRKECGRALAIEHNGDLYSCDHFVEPDHFLGNIHQFPILELASSEQQRAFGAAKSETLPQYCRDCEVEFICHGECPKNRFIRTPDGEDGLNYLCEGFRAFFNHIDPLMQRMANCIRSGQSPASVMQPKSKTQKPSTPRARRERSQNVGRNEPCPCGSGRKFKKCCGG